MTDDKLPSLHDDEDDDEGGMHAADEPTAVWNAHELRDAGLGDLINKPESDPAPAATRPDRAQQAPSIVINEAPERPPTHQPMQPLVAPKGSGELGWGATVALAAALGALVYFAIRYFR